MNEQPNVQAVLSKLAEENKQVKYILYAAESGSRMWGIAKEDSDYDVRFIYLAPSEFHVTAFHEYNRDNVSYTYVDADTGAELDIVGWEFSKAVSLAYKQNENLREWFRSPTVYLRRGTHIERLREFVIRNFSVRSSAFHYLNLGRNHYYKYITPLSVDVRGEISYKKYLYTLRSFMSALWLVKYSTLPPIYFPDLLWHSLDQVRDKHVADEIAHVLDRDAGESASGPRLPYIEDFLKKALDACETTVPSSPVNHISREQRDVIDKIYRDLVREYYALY